jgi:transcriptional repressor NrdR
LFEAERQKIREDELLLVEGKVMRDDFSGGLRIVAEKLLTLGEREIPSEKIGEMVMRELKKLDKVAYVRFASVYRNFEDIDEFSDLIREVSRPLQRRSRSV